MAALIKQYLCCCLPQSRSPPDQSLQDERAPLLNPDILPSAPSRPTQRTTEQEQAERDQLRRILHLAEQRLLSVESLAPFRAVEPATPVATTSADSNKKPSRSNRRRQSRHDQPVQQRSLSESSSSTTLTLTASPRRRRRRPAAQEQDEEEEEEEDSPSRHRRRGQSHSPSRVHPAAGDEGAGPLAPIRVVHLDRNTWTEIEASAPGTRPRQTGSEARRPGSSHSMKTLPSDRHGKSPIVVGKGMSGLSLTTTSSDHDDDDAAEEDFQDAEDGEGGRSSTRVGTVESYRTAREQGDDEDWSTTGPSRDGGKSSTNGRRRHARDLWSQASGKGTDDEQLTRAIEQLERDIDSWTLPPHGPFTADLGGGGGGGGGGQGGKE